jgi:VWFA-related protein
MPRLVTCLFTLITAIPALPQSAPNQQPKPSATPAPTLRTSTRLVVVDVVVTDKNQSPVHNLKQSDFTLLEGNTPQTIAHFEEHTYLKTGTAPTPMPALPPGIFTNYSPAPANGAVNVLLLDALNTPMADQAFVRQQLLKYLQQVQPGTRIAIFGLTSHLTILQGFTSDPAMLKTVMTKMASKSSPLLDDSVGGSGTQNSTADNLEDLNIDNSDIAETIANLRQFEAEHQSFQLQLRAKYTLNAMSQIARYLAGFPGRKNLIWFSGSFPINVLPDTTGNFPNAFAAVASSADEFRDTVDLLARSQVAVYPIDARGLFNSPVFTASTTRNYTGRTGPSRMNQDAAKFFSDTAQEEGTMHDMAQSTGGRAFINSNDLTHAVASAIEDGSNFYTLTYTPTNTASDGQFRKIKVALAQHGLTLAYRQGYYAIDPDKKTHLGDASVTSTTAPNQQNNMLIAMMRGAPIPTEILLKVSVIPITPVDQPEDKPAPRNTPTTKAHGPYRRYSVNYAIASDDITFLHISDGKLHADFDLVTFVFDLNGVLLNAVENPIHISPTPDQIKQSFAHGISFYQEISAPAKGEYFLRIAVHDLNRDRYGAVEVATSAVKNLVIRPAAPPTTPASRPAPGTTPSTPPPHP